MQVIKNFFSHIKPYTVFILYAVFVFSITRIIPNPSQLLLLLEGFYRQYGYGVIFLSAIAEGTFLLGFYIPGSTAILLGAVFSRTGVVAFPLVIVFAVVGLVMGYSINYFLGQYGFTHIVKRMGLGKGLTKAEHNLQRHYKKTILLSYIHPGSGALISTAAGVLHLPFGRFLFFTIVSQTVWALVWGSLAYMVGLPLVELFIKYFGMSVLVVVVLLICYKRWGKQILSHIRHYFGTLKPK